MIKIWYAVLAGTIAVIAPRQDEDRDMKLIQAMPQNYYSA